MKRNPRDLVRYNASERANHWVVGICFILLALSGLAFFHPSLFFFTAFFGGGQWARILHPFFGLAMVGGFAVLFFTMWRENVLDRADREWLAKAPEMLKGNKEGMPAVGKYNAGQKLVFWAFAVSLLLLLVTGFMFWSPWFVHFFPITLRRVAVVVHAASAFVLVVSVMTHIYAAIWIKGTMRAMTRGTVTEGWAKLNHPLWHRKMTRGE